MKVNKLVKRIGVGFAILLVLIGLVTFNIRGVLTLVLTNIDLVQDQSEVELIGQSVWFDDYYTIDYLDENTIAIGEPRYWQKNYNYLIIGTEKAILFDSGPGLRDIEPVVRSLTDLPIISMASHFHYDHVGNANGFEEMLLSENQLLNQSFENGVLTPSEDSFLGKVEGLQAPNIEVTGVVELNTFIDLGNRSLKILPIPGHAENSIALYDPDSSQLFIGDFMIPGVLLTSTILVPDGDFEHMNDSTQMLIEEVSTSTKIFSAHSMKAQVPVMEYEDLRDLGNFMNENVNTTGILPKYKRINDIMYIIY